LGFAISYTAGVADRDELILTLYGLDAFNREVDGEVFARKFFKFMQGLAEADRATNGTRALKYLITDLSKNTATAKVREQEARSDVPHIKSGIEYYATGVQYIYEDSVAARSLPAKFVRYLVEVANDAGETFARAEIKRAKITIPVDEGLAKKARGVLADINRATSGVVPLYQGIAHGSYDGTLLVLDALGGGQKAVLELTAGGRRIDCDMHLIERDKAAQAYRRRCTVYGVAHYDGVNPLPTKIDAVDVVPIEPGEGLARWMGAFERGEADEDWNET
jgi:hypothetical protein